MMIKPGSPWPVCHGLPMIYWPAGDDWACQDITCRLAHGVKHLPLPLPGS